MSEEITSTNDGSHGAPSGFTNQAIFKKKKAKKDGVGGFLAMIAVLGVILSVTSIVLSFLFVGAH